MSGMPQEKVAVIGAGISGVSTAIFLRNAGFDVTVIEARDRPAEAGTSVAPGAVHPWIAPYTSPALLYDLKAKLCPWKLISNAFPNNALSWTDLRVPFWTEPFKRSMGPSHGEGFQKLAGLTTANHALLLQTLRTLKLEVPVGWGMLRVVNNKTEMPRLVSEQELATKVDSNCDIRKVEHVEATSLFPALRDNGRDSNRGLLYPSTVIVDPVNLTEQLARKARDSGVRFLFGTRVEGFDVDLR